MRTCFTFWTCVCSIVLLAACHRFPSSSDAAIAGDTHAHISSLGKSPIGPVYRQKRSQGSVNVNEETNDLGEGSDEEEEEDDDDNDADDEDDDDDDQEEDESLSSPNSRIKENLILLKNTRKSVGRYAREDSHLNELMTESSELAKEVATVFHRLAKREVDLTKEMESLKEALNGAVVNLKKTISGEEENKEADNKVEGEGGDNEGKEGADDDAETQTTRPRQKRHFNYKNPYRACVSIEPMNDEGQGGGALSGNNGHNGESGPSAPGVSVQEYMPSKHGYDNLPLPPPPAPSPQQSNFASQQSQSGSVKNAQRPIIPATYPPSTASKASPSSSGSRGGTPVGNNPPRPPSRPLPMFPQSQPPSQASSQLGSPPSNRQLSQNDDPRRPEGPDQVDLSEVYWLRLDPQRKQEMLHTKVDTLLKEKQHQGKDVLVIPLKHGLHDTEQVKNGFLRAVRVRPKALNKKLFRKLRSLRVLEL